MNMKDEKMKQKKRAYVPPALKSQQGGQPSVLLLCTGEYNCVEEVGYDCCQPNPSTCFTNC